jgi:UTP-glucose-1-phosphate uridylyltransferase
MDVLYLNGIVKGKKIFSNNEPILKLIQSVEKPTYNFVKNNDFIISNQEYKKYNLNNDDDDEKCLCNFGMDILPKRIFYYLEKNEKEGKLTKNELQLRDAMGDVMLENESESNGMYGLLINGKRLDTGIPSCYSQTNFELYQNFIKNN